MKPINSRLQARRATLMAHLEMLVEAEARGDEMDTAQLELLCSEMEFLADLMRTLYVMQVEENLRSSPRA